MRQLLILTLLAAALGGTLAGDASAAAALLAVDDATPSLAEGDDGGWSGTLGLTNLTDGALTLSAAPADGRAGCTPVLSRAAIGAAQSLDTKLTVPKACKAGDDEVALTLTAKGAAMQGLPVTAELKAAQADPDWDQLAAFPVALPVVALVLFLFCLVTKRLGSLGGTLEHLEGSYSFKESWVSNVTVVAGVLTGVFGSSAVVKAFLGEDADKSIALATVGAAIAVVFIGLGPVVLTAAKKDAVKDGERVPAFTGYGLLLATMLTVAGAFGQLWVGWKSAEKLDLDGLEDWVWIAFTVAVALLAWYTLATFHATLKAGTTAPPPPKPSELSRLIELLEEALKKNPAVPDSAIPAVIEMVGASMVAPRLDVLRYALRRHPNVPDDAIDAVVGEVVDAAPRAAAVHGMPATPAVTQRRTAAIL